jgi:hypothetical protein
MNAKTPKLEQSKGEKWTCAVIFVFRTVSFLLSSERIYEWENILLFLSIMNNLSRK